MSELNVQIGQLLKDLRDERGWSLREFGLIVGMNKTYLGDIELGKRNPTMNSLEKIVAGYGLTVKEFFGVIGKKVCPEPNRNPCDKGRLHAGHSIAQQCPSAPPLHLFR